MEWCMIFRSEEETRLCLADNWPSAETMDQREFSFSAKTHDFDLRLQWCLLCKVYKLVNIRRRAAMQCKVCRLSYMSKWNERKNIKRILRQRYKSFDFVIWCLPMLIMMRGWWLAFTLSLSSSLTVCLVTKKAVKLSIFMTLFVSWVGIKIWTHIYIHQFIALV